MTDHAEGVMDLDNARCEDCGEKAVVGLNGVAVCLHHFNARLSRVRETMDALAREWCR